MLQLDLSGGDRGPVSGENRGVSGGEHGVSGGDRGVRGGEHGCTKYDLYSFWYDRRRCGPLRRIDRDEYRNEVYY